MLFQPPPPWLQAPFMRLLPPFITGILVQWYLPIPVAILLSILVTTFVLLPGFSLLPLQYRFRLRMATGLLVMLICFSLGALVLHFHNVRGKKDWFGQPVFERTACLAVLDEEPVEKTNSLKAIASVTYRLGQSAVSTSGKLIFFFKKGEGFEKLGYGTRILFASSPQAIRSSNNPGAFDYSAYCLRSGITHQVYGGKDVFTILEGGGGSQIGYLINAIRRWVLRVLRRNIKDPKDCGLAEALLIGYKTDLDTELVQAYSNTGVVHVIAISGLHLGLIYSLLMFLTKHFHSGASAWIRLLLILAGLWIFSLLAGAQPSVLRSAVMFSFLAVGGVIDRRGSVFNMLALSAFFILCFNPYWLADAGFQLSYAAVLSILLFYKAVYKWCYFPNKLVDGIWQLCTVTLAAQLLTLPVSIYLFHQVPTLFLLTNLLAVPLSSLILLGEILLCVVSPLTPLASLLGSVIEMGIHLMNAYIDRLSQISFALVQGLFLTTLQAMLLTALLVFFFLWLSRPTVMLLYLSLLAFFGLGIESGRRKFSIDSQQHLVLYSVPKQSWLELICGRSSLAIGPNDLRFNEAVYKFHLAGAQLLHGNRTSKFHAGMRYLIFGGKKIWVTGKDISCRPPRGDSIDILVVTAPAVQLEQLTELYSIGKVLVDGQISARQRALVSAECEKLHIPFHDTERYGAFILNL